MPDEITFEAKSDRELLVMVAMQSNEVVRQMKKINSSVQNHERRIANLEVGLGSNRNNGLSRKQKITYGSSFALFLALTIYYLIQLLG